MSAFHQEPHPRAPSPSPSPSPEASNRLLASHHSVYEALQGKNEPPSSSNSTPGLLNMEFSVTSWQSITESFLAPRAASSVLSSSDTEEDDLSHSSLQHTSSACSHQKSASLTATSTIRGSSRADDDKTIEINLNDAIKTRSFFGINADGIDPNTSSFVMPEMMDSSSNVNFDPLSNKILIIGHKKYNFYKQLDSHLRNKFTLNIHDPHKIVIIIFDGLIKIGNILNFIKTHIAQLQEKLFIPIFRNLNSKIVDKILNIYNIELLCPPVSFDNELQVQNLLDFLKEDFIFQSKPTLLQTPYANDNDDEFQQVSSPSIDISPESFQIIKLDSESSCDSNDSNDNSVLDLQRRSSSKSVLITHQIERLRHSKKMKNRKKAKFPRWTLFGISLSIGIGIGVTVALSFSFLKFYKKPPPVPMKETSNFKVLIKTTKEAFRKVLIDNNDMMDSHVSSAKKHVTEISRLVFQGTTSYVSSLKRVCRELLSKAELISSSQGQTSLSHWWVISVC